MSPIRLFLLNRIVFVLGFLLFTGLAVPAMAEVTAFKQAVAEAAADDRDLAAFYRERQYAPVWTSMDAEGTARRAALLKALTGVSDHGLPPERYKTDALTAQMASVKSARDLGFVEVALSKSFLRYARDVQTGMLIPSKIDPLIAREVPQRSRKSYLSGLLASEPNAFMRSLPPQTAEYPRLMKAKMQLEMLIESGGWGPTVPGGNKLEPGDSGDRVVALRNRLIAMGFMDRSATRNYDGALQASVQAFQIAHGLETDGIAGPGTIEMINVAPEDRLKSVIVAMERERWLNLDRGKRHVLVNLTDFHARIVDDGKVTFMTRSVVGKNMNDRRSPEFSDVMEHMVINPTWNVPRSIATKEYLPMLKKNPNAVGHLTLIDGAGRRISREGMDFTQYSTKNFPFDIKQAPGRSNALGLVKFMFPNKHNIYLHDTPQKALFKRETRAFSHGCIRLQDPFDFAYALLAVQEENPKAYFHRILDTRRETTVPLKQPIPVHIIYRTAFTNAKGPVQYRRDVYGRDARIWSALESEGVELRGYRS